MESIYDLEIQNSTLDNKIIAGLDRISQAFKTLLIEKSKQFNLSPIQIQLLIFIQYHSENKATISYLSREFNVSKPTISEAIKVLEQKQYIIKTTDQNDTRSAILQLTALGKFMVNQTEDFVIPFTQVMANVSMSDKRILWKNIAEIIQQLHLSKIISIQRSCTNCKHYLTAGNNSFCNLINQEIKTEDIKTDCPEFYSV